MNTIYLVYYLSPYMTPRIQVKEVSSFDILGAIQSSGLAAPDILAVKMKAVTEVVTGL